MNKQNPTPELRSEKKPQAKVESPVSNSPDLTPEPLQDSQAFNGGAIESQADVLHRLPTSGRQNIMRQISQVQGNRHAQRLAAALGHNASVQPKLSVSQVNDPAEVEADQVAHQVMSMPEAKAQRRPDAQGASIQRQGEGEVQAGGNVESQLASSKGGGNPMNPETQGFMESRFGTDFSGVRVHTDSGAVQMSKDLEAQAFTHGQDIYFNQGKYDPGSNSGKELLAHELTHVVQQNRGAALKPIARAAATGAQEFKPADPKGLLANLAPEMQTKVRALIENAHKKGLNIWVQCGMRTIAEQDDLYAQGRTKKGDIVTQVKGGDSYHNYGIAVDVVFHGAEPWGSKHDWQALGKAGQEAGLEWGGSWKGFVDLPHFQIAGLSMSKVKGWYANGGLSSVWKNIGGSGGTEAPTEKKDDKPKTAVPAPTGTPIGTAKVTTDVLNVRSGPSASTDRLGQLKSGEQVSVYSRSGEWLCIAYNKQTAYVHSSYVAFTAATTPKEEPKKEEPKKEEPKKEEPKKEEPKKEEPTGTTSAQGVSYEKNQADYFNIANQITSVMEGGSTKGAYDALTVVTDGGIVSYGKHQSTLSSGSLESILNAYLATGKGPNADILKGYMPRVRTKDVSLRTEKAFLDALKAAAKEKEMQVAQDMVFSKGYWNPATTAAKNNGIQSPLGYAMMYDTKIQGGLDSCLDTATKTCGGKIGEKVSGKAVTEQQFLKAFNDAREARLESLAVGAEAKAAKLDGEGKAKEAKAERVRADALRGSKYRCRAFRQLIDAGNLNVAGPSGKVDITGPGGKKYTIEGFDSSKTGGTTPKTDEGTTPKTDGGTPKKDDAKDPKPETVIGNALVTADVLNVRMGPSADAAKLGQFTKGAVVPVTGREGDWLKIVYLDKPAYIHSNYATYPAPKKEEPKKEEPKKEEPKTDSGGSQSTSGLDSNIESKIKAFMQRFMLKIKVGEKSGQPIYVTVRTPYHMNAGDRKTNAEANRKASSADAKILSGNGDWLDSNGKADPDSLTKIVQAAVDAKRIAPKTAGATLTADDIRAWMLKYGVGVDCSGFVSQTLNEITGQIAKETGATAPAKFDVGNTGANSLNWGGNPTQFSKVSKPSELRAGDTMWMPGSVSHIIIITNVQQTPQGTIFTTAESSGGGSIGVHDDTYRCVKSSGDFTDLQKRKSDGTWESKNAGGTFRFSRYKGYGNFKDEKTPGGTTDKKTDPKPADKPADKGSTTAPVEKPIGVGTVTASQLNVREGPATDKKAMGQLAQGAKVNVYAKVGDWLKISYEGKTGYVHGAYVSLDTGGKKDDKPVTGGGDTVKKIKEVGKALGLTVKDSNISLIMSAANEFSVTDKAQLAYIFATVHHESHWGDWMTEFASGEAYEGRKDLGNTQKGDGKKYKGRGFVQLTGRINYQQYGERFKIDLINKPELATDPSISSRITVHGMVYGKFTGKKLSDYGSGDAYNFTGARAIINGKDRAEDIAKIAKAYYKALKG